jgi:hypothetical protein
VTAPRYSPSAVRTIEAALGIPANVHSWSITDCESGTIKGVYVRQELAVEAFACLARPRSLFVITVSHPIGCNCPEMVA